MKLYPSPEQLPIPDSPDLTEEESRYLCQTKHKDTLLDVIDVLHTNNNDIYDACCVTTCLIRWLLEHFPDKEDVVECGIIYLDTIVDIINEIRQQASSEEP